MSMGLTTVKVHVSQTVSQTTNTNTSTSTSTTTTTNAIPSQQLFSTHNQNENDAGNHEDEAVGPAVNFHVPQSQTAAQTATTTATAIPSQQLFAASSQEPISKDLESVVGPEAEAVKPAADGKSEKASEQSSLVSAPVQKENVTAVAEQKTDSTDPFEGLKAKLAFLKTPADESEKKRQKLFFRLIPEFYKSPVYSYRASPAFHKALADVFKVNQDELKIIKEYYQDVSLTLESIFDAFSLQELLPLYHTSRQEDLTANYVFNVQSFTFDASAVTRVFYRN